MEKKDALLEGGALSKVKLITLGNGTVGKTSILRCYTGQKFEATHIQTYGVESYKKNYSLKTTGKEIEVSMWDTAGQENFRSLVRTFYQRCDGVILCYDVTQKDTFEAISEWMNQIEDNASADVRIILVANKIDRPPEDRMVSTSQGKKLASKFSVKYFQTSAKSGEGVQEAVNDLVEQIYSLNESKLQTVNGDEPIQRRVTINNPSRKRESDCRC